MIAYKHRETGLYMEAVPMGDGCGIINLVEKISPNSLFGEDWNLQEIIDSCDGGAEYKGGWIELYPNDFEIEEVEVEVKKKK